MRPVLFTLSLLPFLFSFSGRDNQHKGFRLKDVEKSFVAIPAGSFNKGHHDSDGQNIGQKHISRWEVAPFHINKYEVSNAQYLEFIRDIKLRDTVLYRKMQPDTSVWRVKDMSLEVMSDYYFRHPAYANYPVVGIRHDQALAYCEWLSDKYNREPKRKFKRVHFRLPTANEWTFAAMGGDSEAVFPWKGKGLQTIDGKWMANFRVIPQHGILRTQQTAHQETEKSAVNRASFVASGWDIHPDFQLILAPVNAYYPNAYGLYNMAGNAEELIQQKGISRGGSWMDTGFYLQIHTEENYDTLSEASPERGFRLVMQVLE